MVPCSWIHSRVPYILADADGGCLSSPDVARVGLSSRRGRLAEGRGFRFRWSGPTDPAVPDSKGTSRLFSRGNVAGFPRVVESV